MRRPYTGASSPRPVAGILAPPRTRNTACPGFTKTTPLADTTMPSTNDVIVYQGEQGAYSHLACQETFPELASRPCPSFAEALDAVSCGDARYAMIPLENSTAGRVEEIYRQLPETRLYMVAEHFQPIEHCLLALPGSTLEQIRVVASHPQALAQCAGQIRARGMQPLATLDTAGAAQQLAASGEPQQAVIASHLAAQLYGLRILLDNFQDLPGNTTRFVVFSREPALPALDASRRYITTLMFTVRNIPAALYKALGGFATNGINLVKIESYMPAGRFQATQFYVDIEGHRDDPAMQLALQELEFFADHLRWLGTYRADPARYRNLDNE